jgi:hypothetical protein
LVWKSPDIENFVREERRQRLVWGSCLGVIGIVLLLTWVAYAHSTTIERAAATIGGVASLSSAAALLLWRPRYR